MLIAGEDKRLWLAFGEEGKPKGPLMSDLTI